MRGHRRRELRRVHKVERLDAELHLRGLSDREVLEQREVHRIRWGTNIAVVAQRPEGADRGILEGRRVEPCLGRPSAGWRRIRIPSRNRIRPNRAAARANRLVCADAEVVASLQGQNAVHLPTADDRPGGGARQVFPKGQPPVAAQHEPVPDIEAGMRVFQRLVRSAVARASRKRRAGVRKGMPPRIGRQEANAIGVALVQLGGKRVVGGAAIAVREGDTGVADNMLEWPAVECRNIRPRVVDQRIAVVVVRQPVALGADVGHFQHGIPAEIPLQVEIPFVDERPAPLGVDRAERNRRGQRESIDRESIRELLDERISIRVPILHEARFLVEGHVLAPVRIAALVLFGPVEDAVASADHRAGHYFVGNADPRSYIRPVPFGQICRGYPALDSDVRIVRDKVRR